MLVVCLLSLGGLLKRSSERVLVASLVFVDGGSERVLVASLFWLRRGGWELVVGRCGLVGGLEAWWPSLWSQNLENHYFFNVSGRPGSLGTYLLSLSSVASRPVVFRVSVPNP